MNREFQPSLFWAYVADFAAKQWPDIPIGKHDIHCYIYRTDQVGAYYLYGPKLYYTDDLASGHWGNCNQDDLWTNRENLGEIVVHNRHPRVREQVLLGKTFSDAWQKLKQE